MKNRMFRYQMQKENLVENVRSSRKKNETQELDENIYTQNKKF